MAHWTDFEPHFRHHCSSNGKNCNHIEHIIYVLSEISKNILNGVSLGARSSSQRIDTRNEASKYRSITTRDSRFTGFKGSKTHWKTTARNVYICLEAYHDTRCSCFIQSNCKFDYSTRKVNPFPVYFQSILIVI